MRVLPGARGRLGRSSPEEKTLSFEESGRGTTIGFDVSTPDEALERLKLIASVVARGA